HEPRLFLGRGCVLLRTGSCEGQQSGATQRERQFHWSDLGQRPRGLQIAFHPATLGPCELLHSPSSCWPLARSVSRRSRPSASASTSRPMQTRANPSPLPSRFIILSERVS